MKNGSPKQNRKDVNQKGAYFKKFCAQLIIVNRFHCAQQVKGSERPKANNGGEAKHCHSFLYAIRLPIVS